MTDFLEISPCGPIDRSIRPPGSKSLTNRALVCAAAARGESLLTGVLASDDTRVMIDGLNSVGVHVNHDAANATARVVGCGGKFPDNEAELFIENSGTTVRFLTALLATSPGRYRLDGVPRMRQRPIGDLLNAIEQLGGKTTSEADTGCPPVLVGGTGLAGGDATVRGDISSQYLSGLLMAAPLAQAPVQLTIEGELVSKPYVSMTLEVMRSFGVEVESPGDLSSFRIEAPQTYAGCEFAIEPDASAASYFWGAAAIAGGRATVEGLTFKALQGDVNFCRALERMGCRVEEGANSITLHGPPPGESLRGVDIDMNAISDTVQTLAVVALFANSPTTITGVAHNRHKETDRIADLATELRKLGASVEELADGLRITPGPLQPAEIATYHDHRMAMSFSLAGLKIPGVRILDPGCTAKTYPNFFDDLAKFTN